MASRTKVRPIVVRVIHNDDDARCGSHVGPFVVLAASPRGAFRIVRNHFQHYLTDHISREMRPLVSEGVVSDRVGQRLVWREDRRASYAGSAA